MSTSIFFRAPLWLIALAALGLRAPTAFAQSADYDAGRDFSTAHNPNGVWTFGWAGTVTGSVHPLTVRRDSPADNGAYTPSWQLTYDTAPVVYCNISDQTTTVGGGIAALAPHEVLFDGGQDGSPQNFVAIQFTAPTNGHYTVATAVRPFYNGPPQGDADFHVVKNGTELFVQFLNPYQSAAFTNTLALNTGDTIKFLLGRGADGHEYGSIFRITALINPGPGSTNSNNPTNPPQTVVGGHQLGQNFSAQHNPQGAWAYGWSPTVGGAFTPLQVPHTSPTENGVLVPSWQLAPYWAPVVYCNTSSVPAIFGGGAVQMPPGAVWFAPGQDGRPENFTVIQFTAPASSNYLVQAAVQPVYPAWPQGDADFHVVQNTEELYGVFLAPTQTASFSNVVALAAGETIQFVLGRGADGSEYGSSLRIAASITPTGDDTTVITNPPPQAPVIVTQPVPYQSVNAGSSVHLSVVAWGTGPLNYQWLFQHAPLAGAESNALVLPNIQPINAGQYQVVVSSDYGAVTSTVAMLHVTSNAPGTGMILFANNSTNRVIDVDGTNFVTGGGTLVAGLFAGTDPEDLHIMAPAVGFTHVPGRFYGGPRTIPNTVPGQLVWMQVKVWDSAFGDSYEDAVAVGGKRGDSGLFQARLGGSIIPPGTLGGMPSFALSLPGTPAPQVAAAPAAPATPLVLRRLVPAANGWTLTLTGPASTTCAIEMSTDLSTWKTVAYVVNESGVVDYHHGDNSEARRFYRVRLVNP